MRGKTAWIVAGVVVLIAVVLIGVVLHSGRNEQKPSVAKLIARSKPEPAHPFSLPSLGNQEDTISLAQFRGRPLVLNFWASWCVPCRTEMPMLESAYKELGGKIAFLGIDSQDTPAAGAAFARKVGVTYPLASDPKGSVAIDYGLFGLPSTMFISANDQIVAGYTGQLSRKELNLFIDYLLKQAHNK